METWLQLFPSYGSIVPGCLGMESWSGARWSHEGFEICSVESMEIYISNCKYIIYCIEM